MYQQYLTACWIWMGNVVDLLSQSEPGTREGNANSSVMQSIERHSPFMELAVNW
jgi:hypothetical protein